MNNLLASVGLLLIASSCGGGDSGGDMATDLGSSDLASADLFGVTGCKGLIACLNACPPADNGCSFACGQKTTAGGIALYKAGIDCGQGYCVGVNHCAWANAQMTMVKDVAGNPPSVCDDCLTNAESGLFGNNCRQPGSADCTQMQCNQAYANCLGDLP